MKFSKFQNQWILLDAKSNGPIFGGILDYLIILVSLEVDCEPADPSWPLLVVYNNQLASQMPNQKNKVLKFWIVRSCSQQNVMVQYIIY